MKYIVFVFALLLVPQVVFALPDDPRVEQWGYAVTHVYDAWDITTGSDDVVVAIIDNGFDHYHADLIDNVWKNEQEIPRNNIDDDNNGYIDDVYGWNFVPEDIDGDGEISELEAAGNNNPRPSTDDLSGESRQIIHHGTLVAGIIGAKGNNGIYGAGLNWDVSLMNLKIVGNNGNGSLAELARAIRYAVDNGADVISMSVIGGLTPEDSGIVGEAMEYAYDHDVVLVAAAGNTATNLNDVPLYPICVDAASATTTVIGTTAVMEGRRFAVFSNYGSDCIDITAPGHEIASTLRYAPNSGLNLAYDTGYQGTSFAVPFISGTAALIRSVRPDLSAAQVIESILSTTSKTPPEDEALYASLFGRGLIQVAEAITYAQALPINSDRHERTVTFGGVTYVFGADGATSRAANALADSKGGFRVQYDSTTARMSTMAHGRTYEWELSDTDIAQVFLDTSGRSARVIVIAADGNISWYTIDGYVLASIAVSNVFDVMHSDDSLHVLVTDPVLGLVQFTYDRNGRVLTRQQLSLPSDVTTASIDLTSGAVYAAVRVAERTFDIYTTSPNSTPAKLFSYTAVNSDIRVKPIPYSNEVVLFDGATATLYTTDGMFVRSYLLE
jgi:subtilisin family serine protease